MFAPPQIFHKLLFSHVVGKVQSPQEHFKTITYAKLGTEGWGGGGGQTECIMGDSKIENNSTLQKL